MNFKLNLILFFCLFIVSHKSEAQIIPPGLGEKNMASWLAFGVQQDVDTLKGQGWSSTSYLGFGRVSDTDNYNIMQKPSIFINNQEFKNIFYATWEYSLT